MEALKIINAKLTSMNIPYQFMEYNSASIPDEYWVGSYNEEPMLTEDGKLSATFSIVGTSRKKWTDIESRKNEIMSVFRDFRTSSNGKSVTISYDSSFPMFTGNDDIKRIQINLNIQEWGI